MPLSPKDMERVVQRLAKFRIEDVVPFCSALTNVATVDLYVMNHAIHEMKAAVERAITARSRI